MVKIVRIKNFEICKISSRFVPDRWKNGDSSFPPSAQMEYQQVVKKVGRQEAGLNTQREILILFQNQMYY